MYMAKNKGKVFINTRIRDNGKKISIFDKTNRIKKDLKELIPELEGDKLLSALSHVRNFYYGKLHYGRRAVKENLKRKRKLTTIEKIILDYLLKNNLNPSTTYRWFIATRIPEDIKEKLAKGHISIRKAMQISANRLKVKESNHGLLMMEEINNIVGSL